MDDLDRDPSLYSDFATETVGLIYKWSFASG
jgi:hypothetical protein